MIAHRALKLTSKFWLRLRRAERAFVRDRRAIAAIEFAFIVPLMLVLMFGTVEFSTGMAAARKVTLTASALADLTSEIVANGNIAPIADSDLQNMFTAGISIMNPYIQGTSSVTATISEIYVDLSKNATFQWSRAATLAPGASQATFVTSSHNPGDPYPTLPTALQVAQTYVILTEVRFPFVPAVNFLWWQSVPSVPLSDQAFSRPRQATCLVYNGTEPTPVNGKCPTP
jgi:Flp pilus assembly protein TadG